MRSDRRALPLVSRRSVARGVRRACGVGLVLAAVVSLQSSVTAQQEAAQQRGSQQQQQKQQRTAEPSQYDILYAHYLETARQTRAGASAPRWMDSLYLDPKARSVNDLLTVKVVESITATGSADSQVNKSSNSVASIAKLFGIESKFPSAVDPTNLANAASDTKFKGSGSTTRNGVLTANLTVRVAEVLPNGDLALEGVREIDINGDRQMLVLTGVVRPLDIGAGNVVLSTAIGQLRVQYFGNGLIKDALNPGLLVRLFNKIF